MSVWDDVVAAIRDEPGPAPALRAALLAQCILESARGTSRLALDHGNFAGIKWRPEMKDVATRVRYGAHDGADDYCAFASPAAFVKGYWTFIGRTVYDGWRHHADSAEDYLNFIAARGYAGDPGYAAKVVGLLPEARALLGNGAADGGERARPGRNMLGETVGDALDLSAEPDFVAVAGVNHAFHGPRPNGLEGAIVHYDAGRLRPRGTTDDPEWGARNTLNGAVANGYAFCTVSRSGRIYLPANMDWQRWGYHAGPSRCPATGHEGVSKYYVGFEVNSPGLVYPTKDEQTYVPWFNAVRDAHGTVILDAKGRATIGDAAGVRFAPDELRLVAKPDGNIRPGAYVPYTAAQMAAIVAVMLWLRRQYPASFRLDRVFGHDEVSPGRKVDPGGALGVAGAPAMTMAALRADLLRRWSQIA